MARRVAMVGILGVWLALAGCPRVGGGAGVVAGPGTQAGGAVAPALDAGAVVGVLPFRLADTADPLPEAATICRSDGDCVVWEVRRCGAGPRTVRPVNRAAANAFQRHLDATPCPPTGAGDADAVETSVAATPVAGGAPAADAAARCVRRQCTLR